MSFSAEAFGSSKLTARTRAVPVAELKQWFSEGDKPEFVVRTEHTRWYGKVFRSSAEQLAQDLPSVLR